MNKNPFEFGSIRWATWSGKNSSAIIKEIADGGYEVARKHFDFYADGRSNRGAAMTAVRNAAKLIDAEPHYHKNGMIWSLCWYGSLASGIARYIPMRHIGEAK